MIVFLRPFYAKIYGTLKRFSIPISRDPCLCLCVCVYTLGILLAAAEAVKTWDSGWAPRVRGLGACPVVKVWGCRPWKIFKNLGEDVYNLVHFWRPVRQKMYNSSV